MEGGAALMVAMFGKALIHFATEYNKTLNNHHRAPAVAPSVPAAEQDEPPKAVVAPVPSKKRERKEPSGEGQGPTDCCGNWVDGVECPFDADKRDMWPKMVINKRKEPGRHMRICKPCYKATEKAKKARKAAADSKQPSLKMKIPLRHVVEKEQEAGDEQQQEEEEEEEAPALDIEVEDE